MAENYKLNPDYISASLLPEVLAEAGYTPNIEYHQGYYALTSGGVDAVRDRTGHWFLHRDKLPVLARRLKLTPPRMAVVPTQPSTQANCTNAAALLVDAIAADYAVVFAPCTKAVLKDEVALYLKAVADVDSPHWEVRAVEAARGLMCAANRAVLCSENIGTERHHYIVPAKDIGKLTETREYLPSTGPNEPDEYVVRKAA